MGKFGHQPVPAKFACEFWEQFFAKLPHEAGHFIFKERAIGGLFFGQAADLGNKLLGYGRLALLYALQHLSFTRFAAVFIGRFPGGRDRFRQGRIQLLARVAFDPLNGLLGLGAIFLFEIGKLQNAPDSHDQPF
ncbi:hypothetical protein [Leisingera caerulea]|uniref:hypothetical protein n=1 Tax=Leisingera caerulea TaxID=506591 RepID=UPI0012B60782|nr:hypothetical protein [Leisingera caerulea]